MLIFLSQSNGVYHSDPNEIDKPFALRVKIIGLMMVCQVKNGEKKIKKRRLGGVRGDFCSFISVGYCKVTIPMQRVGIVNGEARR